MNNKKGFTLVELIVSFALITAVSFAFFRTILVLQQQQLKNIAINSYKAFTVVLNNSIQKDFLNDNIEKIISCGENCYDITYTTNGIIRLSIDKENNTIRYGSISEKLPKDFKFINNIEFTSYINSYEGNDSYIALNINIKSNYHKNIENIKYVYQYDSDNGVIELDVDGAEASDIIEYLLYTNSEDNGLYEPLLPDGTSTGIRYYGENPNNYVYFNCEDTYNDISYGSEGYDYENACEVWRIIGVFDVDNGRGNIEKRVKLINTTSTFIASWDSSASDVYSGYGINQWGESTYKNGTAYEGADLMRLLNGYYIAEDDSCKYCNGASQASCLNVCDTDDNPLSSQSMKPLVNNALDKIETVIWYTYGVKSHDEWNIDSNLAGNAFLQENGISTQYTGISECSSCSDEVIRTTSWEGLVGLMSISDMLYTEGWLYNSNGTTLYPWTISPSVNSSYGRLVWRGDRGGYGNGGYANMLVWPSLYLKSNVTFVGDGNGTEDNPYILGINE